MAEVTVPVNDEGAAREVGAGSERWQASSTELPQMPEADLPADLPPLPTMEAQLDGAVESRRAPATRPIMPDEWVNDEDDYWTTQSLIAISGRRAVPRPRARELEPPQRFRPVRRWQSMAAVIVLSVVILVTCVGLLRAVSFANNLVHPHQAAPTLTVPTHTPSPTAKPHNK